MTDLITVGFVAPNFQQGPEEFNAYYLPFPIGLLWSYASTFEEVTSRFSLGPIIWRRDNMDEAVEKLKGAAIVGFSTYIWNKAYNYELARRIKLARPNTLIVFGGPEPPVSDPAVFKRFPFIDLIVNKEGEITFKQILTSYKVSRFDKIPGLLINRLGTVFNTGPSVRINDLSVIPSPHLTGFFDTLMAENPTVEWNTILETNRGCPYACTFCDWGAHEYTKIKQFALDRVIDELEWMGKNKIGYISFGDANFGIFPDRDTLIADKLIDVQQRFTYPRAYTINWAKNQKPEVMSIIKKLVNNGSRMGLTASVQSLDDGVLANVKRKNLGISRIEEIFKQCDQENIPVQTELILGLPGETLTSWKANYFRLFEANNHTGITSFNAELLENSEMNLSQREQFKIETAPVTDYICGTSGGDDYPEEIQIVKSTADMPHHDLIACLLFSWFVNTFHIGGLSNVTSRFAYKQGISYKEFYDELYAFLLTDEWFSAEAKELQRHYEDWFIYGKVIHPKIGSTPIYGMNLGQRTSIIIHTDNKYDYVFGLLEKFYTAKFPEHSAYMPDLFTVQRNYFIRHDMMTAYPIVNKLQYNIMGYIQDTSELDVPSEYLFEFKEDTSMSLTRFCELLWFGRRRNFGKAILSFTAQE